MYYMYVCKNVSICIMYVILCIYGLCVHNICAHDVCIAVPWEFPWQELSPKFNRLSNCKVERVENEK